LGDGILDYQFYWYLQTFITDSQWTMDTCDQSFYVLFIMLWSYYYFEATSPASGSFFSDSIRLTLLYVIQAL
jgi:hypothetical protein